MHDISGVHHPESDAAINGRSNVGIRYLEFLIVNLGLIGFDRAIRLAHGGLLGVELLLGNYAILKQRLITRQICFRIGLGCHVLCQLTFACASATWNGRGSISASASPA